MSFRFPSFLRLRKQSKMRSFVVTIHKGEEKLVLKTEAGQSIILSDAASSVEIRNSNGDIIQMTSSGIEIQSSNVVVKDGNGNSIKFDPSGITVESPNTLRLNSSMITISAAFLAVDTGFAKFSGALQCDTLITNSEIISGSYTPGAGNIW